MKEVQSSNLATPTDKSLDNQGFYNKVRQVRQKSAPIGLYDLEFKVEGPNDSNQDTEMVHQVKSVDCGGDITKRWYVEYYIENPETNKRERKREYGFINKFKTLDERYTALSNLKGTVINNLEGELKKKAEFKFDNTSSITYYMNLYLRIKRKSVEPETNKLYTGSLNEFHKYLKKKNLTHIQPHQVSKNLIHDFLNQLIGTVSNRTVNNHFDFIKGFFSYLISDHENILFKNPFTGIRKLPSKSESHVAYSKEQAEKISEYLKEKDPVLLNFCRFVAYGFLRCKETRNLKIGDIDLDKRTITLSAKSAKVKKRMVKPMLDVFYQYLIEMDLKSYPPDFYVFTYGLKPGSKKAYTNCFQKRFKTVKDHFGLSDLHTVYSFRHTFVCELLASGASWHEIMKYTGHTTFAAFEKYARSILNRPAEDLSDNIKIKF